MVSLNSIIQIADEAGQLIERVNPASVEIEQKEDASPVSIADKKAHESIYKNLSEIAKLPILSEEVPAEDYAIRQSWQQYWLIDPLDGTKGWLAGRREFTVNIALIENGKPILGVVHLPRLAKTYAASIHDGAWLVEGAEQKALHTKPFKGDKLRIAVSEHHGGMVSQLFNDLNLEVEPIAIGSAAKFCYIAEGLVDIYPRLSPTSEWDTAAGQCVLTVAGGRVLDLEGETLAYNQKASLINPPFLAVGDPNFDWENYLSLAQWDQYVV